MFPGRWFCDEPVDSRICITGLQHPRGLGGAANRAVPANPLQPSFEHAFNIPVPAALYTGWLELKAEYFEHILEAVAAAAWNPAGELFSRQLSCDAGPHHGRPDCRRARQTRHRRSPARPPLPARRSHPLCRLSPATPTSSRRSPPKPRQPYIIFCGVHFMAESADILARPASRSSCPT